MRTLRIAALSTVFALLAAFTVAVGGPATSAQAADARSFEPGNIISDALFFDGGAFNESQVQEFLNSQVSSCRSGYTCLKDYRQNTATRAAEAGRCQAYAGGQNESAARIIAKVGAACGVSQKALIVLLEKEQGIVTDTWPTDRQYRSATGYGCPDTADCDTAYYGFFNQVYMAALQFKRYAANPTGWNHVAGRVNNVRYHPNGCGTGAVFIQNQATAGLYNYTPYQPNAAALNNLYGTGDACSAYGNRNFWRMYTDWFGSTTAGSSLVRAAGNATVYLTSGDSKYAVPSMAILNALFPLGNIAYVSDQYLDRFVTKHNVGRVLRSSNGSIYFYDAGIKLPFQSCGQVVDYGGSCADNGYIQLTDAQIAAFVSGPAMRPVLGTNEGARYFVSAGTKREILDDWSQQNAGIPAGHNVLTEGALAALPMGQPITRDSVFVAQRGTASYSFLNAGSRSPVEANAAGPAGLPQRLAGSLWSDSLAAIPASGSAFAGAVRGQDASTSHMLAGSGRYEWAVAGIPLGVPVTAATDDFINGYPSLGRVEPGSMIKTASSGTVYVVMETEILPIGSWEGLMALSNGVTPTILILPDSIVNAMPKGSVALTTGTLVRTPENATVFLVNGVTNKVALTTFMFTSEAGINDFSFTTQERLDAYPLAPDLLSFGFQCADGRYVGAGGSVHKVDESIASLYPFTFVPLDKFTCRLLKVGAPANEFIRTPEGSVYLLEGGQKRWINSMERLVELNQGRGWLDVHSEFAVKIPSGPIA